MEMYCMCQDVMTTLQLFGTVNQNGKGRVLVLYRTSLAG